MKLLLTYPYKSHLSISRQIVWKEKQIYFIVIEICSDQKDAISLSIHLILFVKTHNLYQSIMLHCYVPE